MTDPIKLTDEVLYMVDQALAEWGTRAPDLKTRIEGDQVADSIRALRDRARAVVDDATIEDNRRDVVDQKLIEALREVLP